jgi:hypothetical protein
MGTWSWRQIVGRAPEALSKRHTQLLVLGGQRPCCGLRTSVGSWRWRELKRLVIWGGGCLPLDGPPVSSRCIYLQEQARSARSPTRNFGHQRWVPPAPSSRDRMCRGHTPGGQGSRTTTARTRRPPKMQFPAHARYAKLASILALAPHVGHAGHVCCVRAYAQTIYAINPTTASAAASSKGFQPPSS